jgi:ABC-type transport system involved in cytochrome c biogenesis permease subunit
MNFRYSIVCLLLLCGLSRGSAPIENGFDYDAFGRIVIQHEGRLKPLDKFARTSLTLFHEKATLKGYDTDGRRYKKKAIQWLADTLLFPRQAFDDKIFKERNNGVIQALGLEVDPDQLYSFNQLIPAIQTHFNALHELLGKDKKDRSLVENRLVSLYNKTVLYLELSQSLSCFTPDITISDPNLAEKLNVPAGLAFSYAHLIRQKDRLRAAIVEFQAKDEKDHTPADTELLQLIHVLNEKLQVQTSDQLAIVPSPTASATDPWSSPWELQDGRPLSEIQQTALGHLENLVTAVYHNQFTEFNGELNSFLQQVPRNNFKINLEILYEKWDLFTVSLAFYIFALFLLMISWTMKPGALWRISWSCLGIASLMHTAGILMRMLIMGRPPVSTLYESIIFVGWIIILFSNLIEYRRRNGLGLLIGSLSGVVLQFVGLKYSAEGDTLGMLVAVLDSNFWLSTHVVTITTGYGTALVAGIVAHVYLIMQIAKPKEFQKLAEIYKNMIGMSIVALFFTTLGTILGGIWADQSWGRFWGWDPKENGALLIVLWLLMIVHGRVAGQLKELGFAAGMVLCNITVALAWFGVNLLNVGLHSYGFIEVNQAGSDLTGLPWLWNLITTYYQEAPVIPNLILFCTFELLFALVCYLWARNRRITSF